ncbi:Adrenocortical dysplasia protein-like protein [Heterocephalus glaber]|uniref:Adrenocortical dysplasia protein-like protein n=1 Tax=Heterocephalus glaber TaxID=10181 RepID=G5C667_HETGA|nr:Adrenocortical dysplasia protein-like protein [Heterocephalus glaber]
MASMGSLVLRPWIRELILGSEALPSPQAGQLLKVLQDVVTAGPSHVPDILDGGAMLLVSDGTHSVRCLVTQEALNTSDWEEKEFGFSGAEGRLLLLQVCGVRIQIADGGAPAEFYLQVDRFNLLPTEQPRVPVTGCNQDLAVQRKLYDCLEDHLSESNSSNAGLTLTQLLDEVQEDQEHREALVRLAESCLILAGPCTAPPLTHWAASRCRAMASSPRWTHNTKPQKPNLELKEQELTPNNQQPSPRTRTKRAQEPCAVWDPPKRHHDGSAFQYEYEPPCASLCAQVQAARLPPQLVAWALHFLMEPEPESELTEV